VKNCGEQLLMQALLSFRILIELRVVSGVCVTTQYEGISFTNSKAAFFEGLCSNLDPETAVLMVNVWIMQPYLRLPPKADLI
jgi:hypothetical protein